MKRMKVMLVSVLAVLTMGLAVAQSNSTAAPDWMLNSKIQLSELAFGKSTTISDIVSDINTNAKVAFSKSGNSLKLAASTKYGGMDLKFDTTFVCSPKDGTCYISNVTVEIPALGEKNSVRSSGPSDSRNYGECLGALSECMEIFLGN